MHSQISKYILGKNIISSAQSGFRECHSTTTGLTTIVDDLLRSSDEGKASCLILLDYSKEFDTMDPTLFCDQLKYYRFDEKSVRLLQNYLSGRFKRVSYNLKYSQPL